MAIRKKRVDRETNSARAVRKTKICVVSIITVCRNAEKTIAATIESVLHQTYKHVEYIIIDGASTDRTMEIAKIYEPKFRGRMRLISEPDAGIYDAMNKGIALATGELIGILNADDWYELDALESVVQEFMKQGTGVYYGLLRYWSGGKEKMIRTIKHEFLHQDTLPHPTCFVSRSLYQQYGNFTLNYRFAADYDLLLRFYTSKSVKFVFINTILANFNDRGASTKHEEQALKEMYTIQYHYGFMETKIWLVKMLKKNIAIILKKLKLINE